MSKKSSLQSVAPMMPKDSKGLQWGILWEQSGHLLGEVLTIIDALGLREGQDKAVKDLVRDKFQKQKDIFWDFCFRDDREWSPDIMSQIIKK